MAEMTAEELDRFVEHVISCFSNADLARTQLQTVMFKQGIGLSEARAIRDNLQRALCAITIVEGKLRGEKDPNENRTVPRVGGGAEQRDNPS